MRGLGAGDGERRLLQVAVALGGIIPISAGLGGVLAGAALTADRLGPAGDSHFRYLSGLLLGIGLAFWWTIPAIERRSVPFALLTGIVVVGGIGRLIGFVAAGSPGAAMSFALGMELIVTPALLAWQRRIARRAARAAGDASRA